MKKNIAVVLSGCGVMDGSEIHEAVACLLALEKAGVHYQCVAPNMTQTHVVNHLDNQIKTSEKRNVLEESARIARGNIKDIATVNIEDFDGVVYAGGYGAALNLCDFAIHGTVHHVQKDVLNFAQAMAKAKKPQGFACISPVLVASIYGPGVKITIGSDESVIESLEKMGNVHQCALGNDIVVDNQHRVVTTPAYKETPHMTEVFDGIQKMVNQVVKFTQEEKK